MNKTSIAILALAGSLFASPAFAEGINGNWTCAMSGIAIGHLQIERDGYIYARPGVTLVSMSADQTALGTYTFEPTITGTNDAMPYHSSQFESNLVHISDGPLREIFDIEFGFLNDTRSPARLAFNIRPGLGLICSPV